MWPLRAKLADQLWRKELADHSRPDRVGRRQGAAKTEEPGWQLTNSPFGQRMQPYGGNRTKYVVFLLWQGGLLLKVSFGAAAGNFFFKGDWLY